MKGVMGGNSARTVIIGGGVAGLSAAYYAKQAGIDFRLFEAADNIGGNCSTFRHGSFKLDSGAHRFHDKEPEVTKEIKRLMGLAITEINLPSMLFDDGRFIHFPLQPFELLRHLGFLKFALAGIQVLGAERKQKKAWHDFEQFALGHYGRLVAERFLLNYSEKLWGRPCHELSASIAGKRLKGLGLKTFLTQSFKGKEGDMSHMEGRFYYPEGGIQGIAETLGQAAGRENIQCGAEVTALKHDGARIRAVVINHSEVIPCRAVVNTLPLDRTVEMLDPAVTSLRTTASLLAFRHIRLAAFFIARPSILRAATLYFPSRKFPFTRLYEPRNRNAHMAPVGETSLVAEVPCFESDRLAKLSDRKFLEEISSALQQTGLVNQADIKDQAAFHVPYAYPVLSRRAISAADEISGMLSAIGNMHMLGRNARYQYSWIHDMLIQGKELIRTLSGEMT